MDILIRIHMRLSCECNEIAIIPKIFLLIYVLLRDTRKIIFYPNTVYYNNSITKTLDSPGLI